MSTSPPPSVNDPDTRAAWGPPGAPPRLPGPARRWLARRTGLALAPPTARTPAPPTPAPSPLAGGAAGAALREALGAEAVRTDDAARAAHAGGMSYVDLARRRAGHPVPVPDAVLLPASHDQVLALLAVCAEHDVAVVPFGGGTSVVGGVEALRGGHAAVVAVDLSGLAELHAVDRESLTATLGAGLRGPAADRLLAAYGLTLGHVPQSYHRATVGGFAATRSAGQASGGFGRFDDMVVALAVATPAGELRLGRAPASAAGPDLRQLVLGSEGAFGIITEVTVRVRPLPARRLYEAWSVPSFDRGADLVRHLAQDGALADVTRLSDADETEAAFVQGGAAGRAGRLYLRSRGQRRPCLLVLGFEGGPGALAARHRAAVRVLRGGGAVRLGRRAGRSWEHGRYGGPHLRDALLAGGALVETLETAAAWSRLGELRRAVSAALDGALRSPLVMCHLSHAYPDGASLYFTVVADGGIEQWRQAKRAASEAIARTGGTITHHHGVGTDHLPWLAGEIGELGVAVLRAVKDRLDPTGICNPGKLLPGAGRDRS